MRVLLFIAICLMGAPALWAQGRCAGGFGTVWRPWNGYDLTGCRWSLPPFTDADLAVRSSDGKPPEKDIVPTSDSLWTFLVGNEGKRDPGEKEKPFWEYRADLAADDIQRRFIAAQSLVWAKDWETVKRLVYALRQGDAIAQGILLQDADWSSIRVASLLVEDVAHGSRPTAIGERFTNGFDPEIRAAATMLLARYLAHLGGVPDHVHQWLDDMYKEGEARREYVPEQAKMLVSWWWHNESALVNHTPERAIWLPSEIIAIRKPGWSPPRQQAQASRASTKKPVPERITLSEPYTVWAARMERSRLRDLHYVLWPK